MSTGTVIKLAVSAVALCVFIVLKVVFRKNSGDENGKSKKKGKFATVGIVISGWYFLACVVNTIKGGGGLGLEIELMAPRSGISFGSYSVPQTTLVGYAILAIVLVLSLVFRIFVFPKFDPDNPKGFQNVIELAVEACHNFVAGKVGDRVARSLSPYIFSVAVFILGSAFSELFGQRPPTADLVITFSLALMTLFMINFYGIREKKLSGRIKSLASPSPVILPMKILSDCATPVSLACRLFGNMLGGMIVMDLLRNSLGGYAIGITSLAGLYFNLFHPAIQCYIFIILTLTFINEATETAEE